VYQLNNSLTVSGKPIEGR